MGARWSLIAGMLVASRARRRLMAASAAVETTTEICRRFTDHAILVSGGGEGIGRACAYRLAAEGARVAVTDIDEQAARRVVTGLPEPAKHVALRLDVTNRASVDAGVALATERFGGLDVLVAVAGGDVQHSDFEHTGDDVWRTMLELNLLGAVRCCRATIPHLRRSRRFPAIVMISSVNALTGIGSEPYSSAKAGLSALTHNLAVQLGPAGIRVNTIAPGTVRTHVWDRQPGGADRMVPLYPLGRVGEPEDIAAGVAFLASADASWITGLVMPIDGGLLAGHPLPEPSVEEP